MCVYLFIKQHVRVCVPFKGWRNMLKREHHDGLVVCGLLEYRIDL